MLKPIKKYSLTMFVAIMVVIVGFGSAPNQVAYATPTPAEIAARITEVTGLNPIEISQMFAVEQDADIILIHAEVDFPIVLEPRLYYLLIKVAATGQWIRMYVDAAEWSTDFRPYLEEGGVEIHQQLKGTVDLLTPAEEVAQIAAIATMAGATVAYLVLDGQNYTNTGGLVGRTAGVADVTSAGEATYTIPIFAPPGINGLTPELAFTYSHRRKEGIAGVGWGVSGLSQIVRCAKSIAQNGTIDGVNLERDDRYCLDGNQLRTVSGTYGYGGSTYRTEVDLVSRITANGSAGNGPAWFKVEAKDGLIYEYGNSTDSRIESLAISYTTTARSWALNKISDRSGNEVRFTYIEDGAPFGSYRIDKIEYRINTSAGIATPGYKVDFVYESQPADDVDVQYGAGGLIEDIKRLDRIDVLYTVSNPDALVRQYDISYEPSLSTSNRSRIESIQECAGSPLECLQATVFTYQNGTSGLSADVSSGSIIPSGTSALPIDINGDGRTDLVYPSSSTAGKWMIRLANNSGGYGPAQNSNIDSTNHAEAITFDYNSDGIEDILVPYSGTTWWAIQGNGAGFSAPIDTGAPDESGIGNALALDMDGDGRQDLVWKEFMNGLFVRYRLPTGGFSATPTTLATVISGQGIKALTTFRMGSTTRFDANGDGLEDIAIFRSVVRVGHYIHVLLGGGGAYFVSTVPSNSAGFPIDINGDGYTDIAYYAPVTFQAPHSLFFQISTGETLAPAVAVGTFPDLDLANALPMDWDNDGLMDIVVPNTVTGTLYLLRSKGLSFDGAVDTLISSSTIQTAFRTDSNGDGMDDVAFVESTGTFKHKPHAGA